MGLKKKAVVYALRYGGKYLDDIIEFLSKSNAHYLEQHSARTIAWAIMFIAF